jgi:hypothetical protein
VASYGLRRGITCRRSFYATSQPHSSGATDIGVVVEGALKPAFVANRPQGPDRHILRTRLAMVLDLLGEQQMIPAKAGRRSLGAAPWGKLLWLTAIAQSVPWRQHLAGATRMSRLPRIHCLGQ